MVVIALLTYLFSFALIFMIAIIGASGADNPSETVQGIFIAAAFNIAALTVIFREKQK